ncbi:MAG: BtpA/SgcQ family protein [Chloroflexi bacterium]|nr:BtpA/SgcQ family protein [Chloroflexota bacterium]
MTAFDGIDKPLVAMIHLPPLPGAANYDGRPVREIARVAADEARLLEGAGFDGVMIQNTHDRPARVSLPVGSTAALAAVTTSVRDAVSFEVGVNGHKNDAEAALAVAVSCAASFVRIKVLVGAVVGPEGIVQGSAERALDVRREYASDVEIWADLYELTSWPLAATSLENLADLTTRFGEADRLIVTDPTVEASRVAVGQVRTASALPVLIGGRTNADNIREALDSADGVIVGTCLRQSARTDQPLDPEAVDAFMRAARAG